MTSFEFADKPLLDALRRRGLEVDQRFFTALENCGDEAINDGRFFMALYRTNCLLTRRLVIDDRAIKNKSFYVPPHIPIGDAEKVWFKGRTAESVFIRAIQNMKSRRTLGVRDFLMAVLEIGLERVEDYPWRPFTVDLLDWGVIKEKGYIGLKRLLNELKESAYGDEDYQYILTLTSQGIAFRIVSVLDDYVQETSSGLLVPHRALLTHFMDQFGGFTVADINELEELLNRDTARESDFQSFFENHPNFLRMWDYREIYPQVTLARPEGLLVPDFLLTDRRLQRAAVLDLKLPSPKLIRRQKNRDRFASAVVEARTQLLRYRDWFRQRDNRLTLKQKVGMEIYEPHLIVVIGRANEFQDEFDRQRLKSDNPDIEVVTYDDILEYSRRRRIIISGEH
ncbi:MAG TPA: Shedu anti-phage system protein SduA domain-containing protein [Nitrososphaera sp.]|jgi:hypothetical protein|nr:Shedu anti-phage system protein SduA domain-containing protein [Nitrososphaera sp.]